MSKDSDEFLDIILASQQRQGGGSVAPVDIDRRFLERLGSAFSKTGAMGREAIMQTIDGDLNLDEFSKIMKGEKELTAHDTLQKLTGKTIDGVPGYAVDLAFDIATDPLTYLAAPLYTMVKGSKILSKLPEAASSAIARGATGATIGALSTMPEDDALDVIGNIAVGAGIGAAVSPLITKAGSIISKAGDGLVDKYYKTTRPEAYAAIKKPLADAGVEIPTVGEATELTRKFTNEMRPLHSEFLGGRQNILDELTAKSPEMLGVLDKVITKGAESTIEHRNFLNMINKANIKKGAWVSDSNEELLRYITKQSNSKAWKGVTDDLARIGNPNLTKAVKDYASHNRKMIGKWNKQLKNPSQMIEPLDFHIADVATPDDFKSPLEFLASPLRTGFQKRGKVSISDAGLSLADRSAIEAQRYANAFAGKHVRAAQRVLKIPDIEAVTDNAKLLELGLKKYDRFTGFLKTMHLTFTYKWLANNYVDNSMKAYLKHGFKDTVGMLGKTAPARHLISKDSDSVYNEMLKAFNPRTGPRKVRFNTEELQVASDTGVVGSSFFDDIKDMARENMALLIAKKGRKEADKIAMQLEARTGIGKAIDGFQDHMWSTVGNWGAASEGTARVLSFRQFYKQGLQNNKAAKKVVDKVGLLEASRISPEVKGILTKSKDMVNDTFFDYKDVSAFEQKVLKRIFPYWSFFSRNMKFWSNEIFTNTEKVAKMYKIVNNMGRTPTVEEREGIPEWLLKFNPRVSGKDSAGNLMASYMPSMSMNDAIALVRDPSEETLGLVNPILKSIYEQFTNTDLFLGTSLEASGIRGGKKPVFSQALLLDAVPGIDIKSRPSGSLYVDSDVASRVVNLKSNLLPTPAIDLLLGSSYDLLSGRKSPGEVGSKLTPFHQRKVSAKQQQYARKRKQKAREKNEK